MKTFMKGGWAVLMLIIAACSPEQKNTSKFFDFDELIDEQISQLSQRKRVLEKVVQMSTTKSDTAFLPSVQGWGSELEIFRQLETFNKPTYQNAYQIKDSLNDPKSNLKIRQFEAADVPVPLIRFYYQGEFIRLRRIYAEIAERNLLYSTRRILTIDFEEEDGKPLLAHYGVSGFQKMILRDTVRFSIQGQIDW